MQCVLLVLHNKEYTHLLTYLYLFRASIIGHLTQYIVHDVHYSHFLIYYKDLYYLEVLANPVRLK